MSRIANLKLACLILAGEDMVRHVDNPDRTSNWYVGSKVVGGRMHRAFWWLWEAGLITLVNAGGDQPVVAITPAGRAQLAEQTL